jgi:hypothetical protein
MNVATTDRRAIFGGAHGRTLRAIVTDLLRLCRGPARDTVAADLDVAAARMIAMIDGVKVLPQHDPIPDPGTVVGLVQQCSRRLSDRGGARRPPDGGRGGARGPRAGDQPSAGSKAKVGR